MIEIKGACFGARIEERVDDGSLNREDKGKPIHPLCTMLVEDDENWFDAGMSFDIGWCEDIIQVLTTAKAHYERWLNENR